MTKDIGSAVFETALSPANCRTIQTALPRHISDGIGVGAMMDDDTAIKKRVREMMECSDSPLRRLFRIEDEVRDVVDRVGAAIRDGRVAAVDGTNAMNHVQMMSRGAFACAVGYVTALNRGSPHVVVTTTTSQYCTADAISGQGGDDVLAMLCDELDQTRIEQSWTTTFREYWERDMAIKCPTKCVLIDGPIFTQNLMSQASGRAIYEKMMASGKTFIGVIKDLSGSWTISKWCGYSLEPGEAFIVGPIKSQFTKRFETSGQSVLKWVESNMTEEDPYVRVVFRPRMKAFGLECRLSHVRHALAITVADASETLHHELPLLLETIDAQMRGGFNGGHVATAITNDVHSRDATMGIDVITEREFR